MKRPRMTGWEWRALTVLIAFGASNNAIGSTWFVEKDGSGDFTIIQEAVDAAAAGDTIRIGPGRFSEFEEVDAPGWTEPAAVWINEDGLVLIGSGSGETRIGPESYYGPVGVVPKVICCIDEFRCILQDLTIENCRDGIYWGAGGLELHNCEIINCEFGLFAFANGGIEISNSTFNSERGASYSIVTYSPTNNVSISDCRFSGSGLGASFSGSTGVVLSDNVFECAGANIMFYGTLGRVEHCTTDEDVAQGIVVGNNSEVELVDCEFHGWYTPLTVHSGSLLDATQCLFSGGIDYPTIYIYSTSQVTINSCDILNGGNYSVKLAYFLDQFIEHDMTGNYWGTTDPDSIAAMIWDSNDDPEIHSTVLFEPFAGEPVPTEETSFGSIKAMFR